VLTENHGLLCKFFIVSFSIKIHVVSQTNSASENPFDIQCFEIYNSINTFLTAIKKLWVCTFVVAMGTIC